jgi:hypothetical protein
MPEITEKLIWGLGGFLIGVFFKTLVSEFSKDSYKYIKHKIKFWSQSEHEVEDDFKSKIYAPQNYTWIPSENLENKLKHKWFFHPHPKFGGKCIRIVDDPKFPKKEYLMVTAGAKKNAHNKWLKRTNVRCHHFCKATQKSHHQTFTWLAGRYESPNFETTSIFL